MHAIGTDNPEDATLLVDLCMQACAQPYQHETPAQIVEFLCAAVVYGMCNLHMLVSQQFLHPSISHSLLHRPAYATRLWVTICPHSSTVVPA